ncbi:hypothetical protein ACWGOQ_0002725 [Aquimarina sp. M1]
MSLIIGKKELRTILFLADTKLTIDIVDKSVTGGNKMRVNPLHGILKTYILNSKVCISFAGRVENSIEIIKMCINDNPENIPEYLKEKLRQSNDKNSEFLVGISEVSKTFMYKVNYDNITSGETFWTGNQNGFNDYQFHYHNEKNYNENKFNQSQAAFADLVTYTNVPTVGEFIVETIYDTDYKSFMYCERLMSFRGERVFNVPKGQKITLDIEGSSEIGSFQVSNLVSKDINKPAVALFFPLANSGVLFTVNNCLEHDGCGKVYRNKTVVEFKDSIYNEYGILLEGYILKDNRPIKI